MPIIPPHNSCLTPYHVLKLWFFHGHITNLLGKLVNFRGRMNSSPTINTILN